MNNRLPTAPASPPRSNADRLAIEAAIDDLEQVLALLQGHDHPEIGQACERLSYRIARMDALLERGVSNDH